MTTRSGWADLAVDERPLPAPTAQVHAANLAVLADGSLGCVWFGGTQEGMPDIDIWWSHLPQAGDTWSDPLPLSSDRERSEQNPVVFTTPSGEMWLVWTAQVGGRQETAEVRRRVSTDMGRSWSAPTTLFAPDADGGVFVRHPPAFLPDGRWVLPVFRCALGAGELAWSGAGDHSAVRISDDSGETWREVPVPESDGLVHMSVVAPETGRLVALFRSRWADRVHRSESIDSGEHWSPAEPTNLPNNNSSIQALATGPGEILLVYNHSSAADATERRVSLYDEIEDLAQPPASPPPSADSGAAPRRAFWGAPRAPLSLAVSSDAGRVWRRVTDLAVGDGYCMTNNSRDRSNRELSYPSIVRTGDGAIHVAYTFHRREIRHLRISPSGG